MTTMTIAAAALAAFGTWWMMSSRKSANIREMKIQTNANLRARYLRDHPEDEQAWKRKSKDQSGEFGRR